MLHTNRKKVKTVPIHPTTLEVGEFLAPFVKKYLDEIKKDKIIIVVTHEKDFIDAKEDAVISLNKV